MSSSTPSVKKSDRTGHTIEPSIPVVGGFERGLKNALGSAAPGSSESTLLPGMFYDWVPKYSLNNFGRTKQQQTFDAVAASRRNKSVRSVNGNIKRIQKGNNSKRNNIMQSRKIKQVEKKIEKKVERKEARSSGLATSVLSLNHSSVSSAIQQPLEFARTPVTKSEPIMEIFGTATWSNNIGSVPWLSNNPTGYGFNINPGQSKTFPWLSIVAQAFEFYKFRKLVFEYRTTSGEVISGTNPALGIVDMNTNYDAKDAAFLGKTSMENYGGLSSDAPFHRFFHTVDCGVAHTLKVTASDRGGALFVRTPGTSLPTGAYDAALYDVGLFQIATSGCPGTGKIGELWVHYTVDFFKPALLNTSASGSGHAHNNGAPVGAQFTGLTLLTGSTVVITGASPTAAQYRIPNAAVGDVYRSTVIFVGTVTGPPSCTFYTGGGGAATLLNVFNNDTASTYNIQGSGANTTMLAFAVTSLDSGGGACITVVNGCSGNINVDVFVDRLPAGLIGARSPFTLEAEDRLLDRLFERLQKAVIVVDQKDSKDNDKTPPTPPPTPNRFGLMGRF